MTIRSGRLAGLACAFALALMCQQPVAAAPPSAFGPEVKVGAAQGSYIGALDVVPDHGKAGDALHGQGRKASAQSGLPADLAHRQWALEGDG